MGELTKNNPNVAIKSKAHLVQPVADVLAEIGQGLIDVGQLPEAGHLVQLLPRLNVHDGQPRVERVLEILQTESAMNSPLL